jgi:hypothetical protein
MKSLTILLIVFLSNFSTMENQPMDPPYQIQTRNNEGDFSTMENQPMDPPYQIQRRNNEGDFSTMENQPMDPPYQIQRRNNQADFSTMPTEVINTSSQAPTRNNGNFIDDIVGDYMHDKPYNFKISILNEPIPKKTIENHQEVPFIISSQSLMELNSMDNSKSSSLINSQNLRHSAYLKSYEFIYFLINLVKFNEQFFDNNSIRLRNFSTFKQNPIHENFLRLNSQKSNLLDMTIINQFLKDAFFSENKIANDSVFQMNFSMEDEQQKNKINGNITDAINLAIINIYKETNPTHGRNQFHNIKCFKNFDEMLKFAILELAIFYKIHWNFFMEVPIINGNGNLKNCLAKGDEGFVVDYFQFRLNEHHTTKQIFNNFCSNSNPQNGWLPNQNYIENLGNSVGMLKSFVNYFKRTSKNFNNLALLFVSMESESLEHLPLLQGCPLGLMPFPTGPYFDGEKEIHMNLHRFHVLSFSHYIKSTFFANQFLAINGHLIKLTKFVKRIKTIIKNNPDTVCEINIRKRDKRRTLDINKIGEERIEAEKNAVKAQKRFFRARQHLIRNVIEKFLEMAGKEYNEIYNINPLDHKKFTKKFIYHLTEMIKSSSIKTLTNGGATFYLHSYRKQIYSRCFGYVVNEFPFTENKFKDIQVTSLYKSIIKYKDFSKFFSFVVNGKFLLNVSNYGEDQDVVPEEFQYNKLHPKTGRKQPRKKVAIPIPLKINEEK